MWANSANKFFDALAAGRPVAINHQGWLAEVIRQTGCGLVLDPHDVERSAGQLTAAVRDPAWLGRAGSAAEWVGRTRFDRNKLAQTLESVLRRAVPERHRLRPAA
jgi:hypothetical protein